MKLLQLLLEQLLRFWDFIGTCFMMFWTHPQSGTVYKNDIGGLLQWHKEEISRLEEISNRHEVLNKNQCKHLLVKLNEVVEFVGKMITLSSEVEKFGIALEELCCIIRKLGVIVSECGNENWCEAIAFQINNREVFRELVSDLRCCWEVIHEIYSASHSRSDFVIFSVDFNMPTLREIEEDEGFLQERLKDGSNSDWTHHLWQRLGDLQLEGGELDGVEVPFVTDSLNPKLIKQIGEGGYGSVYESIWLGVQCATKILPVSNEMSNFRKEAGILAGLSHPNLIKFIYCGVGGSIDELCSSALKDLRKCEGENDKNLENLYLVMEFMDKSLSDMLLKPLCYFLAIDIMYQIASGMCYLHDMHVAHLDLKPANVLMRRNYIKEGNDGQHFLVKLADYGTSKIEVESKVFKNQKFDRVGTPKYMAPEIIQKNLNSNASFFQADVWSFAMTCSEILSQTAPFGNDHVEIKNILKKLKESERPKLPMNCEELTRLIEECWVDDPLQRPTFFEICEKLIDLKKKFLRGSYSPSLFPAFENNGALIQKKSRIEKANEVKQKHIIKVNEAPMEVNNMVVGLESNLTKVRDRLGKVRILGLIGMGGIGKTTLANAIFNEFKSKYNASCVAKDLKNKSDSFDILCDMLKDLQVSKSPTNVVDAQTMLKEFLVDKKVLIILDDIKDEAQLDDLLQPDILNDNTSITLINNSSLGQNQRSYRGEWQNRG